MLDLRIFKHHEDGSYNRFRHDINIIGLMPYIDDYLEDGKITIFTKREMQQLATYYMGKSSIYDEYQVPEVTEQTCFYVEDVSTDGGPHTVNLTNKLTGMMYSTDLETWTDWTDTTVAVEIPTGSKLYIKGTADERKKMRFSFINKVNVGGNVSYLKDGTDTYPITEMYCLGMFGECTTLISAEDLILPSKTLAGSCYSGMFSGCTSLTTTPELPATVLANDCYGNMFAGCTSLKSAPKLPATTLAPGCYDGMFAGCTSLINAPELPATVLVEDCYGGMFYECTSLTTAPKLPATTLAGSCYGGMFSGCTSLITPPELPATALAPRCYSEMFSGCTSLINAPELPATVLAGSCYGGMFLGCTSLTTAPALPATTLADGCYQFMFQGCTSLNMIILYARVYAEGGLDDWVEAVAELGDFYNLGQAPLCSGTSGIPNGWTVHTTAPETCTLSLYGYNCKLSGSGTYPFGSRVKITCNPNTGYYFNKWGDRNTSNPRTITLFEDMDIIAKTSNKPEGTIIITSINNEGNVVPGTPIGEGTYPIGTVVEISFTPNQTRYIGFDHWSDGNRQNPRFITVTGDIDIVAVFQLAYA